MNRLYSQFRYIMLTFKQHFFSLRTIGFFALQFFILHVFLSPLKDFCRDVQYPVSPWSLVFAFTSPYFTFFFFAGIIFFFSNVPYMQYDQMYQVIRTGRLKWISAKMIHIFFSSIIIVVMEIVLSFLPLLGSLQIEAGWGKVLYTLSMTEARELYGIPFTVYYDVLNFYEPYQAMLIISVILILLILFFGLLMFCLSLYFSRMTAITIAMGINIFQIVALNISSRYPWIFFVSPVSWVDIIGISMKNDGKLPSFSYIVSFLIVASIILILLNLRKIKKIDLEWYKEE